MTKMLTKLAVAAGLSITAILPAAVAPATAQPAPAEGASPAQLLQRIDIPYETFTLDNGLRVIVHEDRKAPIVAVSIWYNVGSKDEPPGRTGFAHLFEHIMFNGSENAPGDYFEHTRAIGATDLNGTTWFDRTNYFQTVPRPALEQALFLESDRMGHLLGALKQETLTNQIGVVQNEKRQGDNQPYGMVEYRQLEALFPEGHPYRHSTIGSMADLSAATLDTAREWFRDNYGPNNAVLVLAGDIDAAEARPLVERQFGHIPRGPANEPAQASVPTLPARIDETMHDRVAQTRLYRDWVVPGLTDADVVPLAVGATVLGGLASSRLDNILVRQEQSAVRVTANLQPFHRVGMFEVTVDVKPGEDAAAVGRRLDEIIADFVRTGPTEDEVRRAVMRTLSGRVQGLEQVGGFRGKAVALAEGMLYANDPAFYRRQMEQLANVTPEQVRSAMQRWLTRPVYALTVAPGEREAYEEAPAVASASAPAAAASDAAAPPSAPRVPPGVSGSADLAFPATERARLSNGIEVVYARRDAVPVTRIVVEFDAGAAADPAERIGTQALMLKLLTEGTTSLDSTALAEAQERLGATVSTAASLDRSAVTLTALTPNLGPSLDLLADVIRNPAFAPAEVERIRQQQLAAIAQEMTNPTSLALRALQPLLYGQGHPYAKPGTGTGHAEVVQSLTRDELVAFHQSWLRPDNAAIFVVGDLPLDRLVPLLEARFGRWAPPAAPRGTKAFPAHRTTAGPRIVLIDRPQSPQSMILAGQLLPAEGTQDQLDLEAANEVLAGDFLSRINMDLRETKGWSYGAGGFFNTPENQLSYVLYAPVQADRTGDSIRAMREQVNGFLGQEGVKPAELERTVLGNVRQLPGQFETSPAVLDALRANALLDRPDDYWSTIADRYESMTAAQLDAAARRMIDPDTFVWIVVGDRAAIDDQLKALGMPIEYLDPGDL